MTSTIIRIGNSKGVIIPARMLKSLTISEKDEVEIVECNGGIMIRKAQPVEKETPFSALDRWVSDNGFNDSDPVTEALEYVESIRQTRNNKDLKEW